MYCKTGASAMSDCSKNGEMCECWAELENAFGFGFCGDGDDQVLLRFGLRIRVRRP